MSGDSVGEFFLKQQEERWQNREIEISHRTLTNTCAKCDKTTGLKFCAKCKLRSYCCQSHQRDDWSEHKKFCRIPLPPNDHNVVITRKPGYCPPSADTRKTLTDAMTSNLATAIGGDVYPSQEIESVFGIKMTERTPDLFYVGIDWPIGNLMYHAWCFIFKCAKERALIVDSEDSEDTIIDYQPSLVVKAKQQLINKISDALLNGLLPQFFEKAAMESIEWASTYPLGGDSYVEELVRREFRGIQWDYQLLAAIAGK